MKRKDFLIQCKQCHYYIAKKGKQLSPACSNREWLRLHWTWGPLKTKQTAIFLIFAHLCDTEKEECSDFIDKIETRSF